MTRCVDCLKVIDTARGVDWLSPVDLRCSSCESAYRARYARQIELDELSDCDIASAVPR